jgi:hypothetical protein
VNLPIAVLPPTSVAVTVVPDVPLGTLKVHVNDPVPLVVNEPLMQLVIVLASKISDFNFVDTEKPVPVTVTIVPGGPFVGLTVIFGVVTVNLPVATAPVTSFAVTVVPEVPPGTLNVQLNAPVAPDVREPLVQVVIVLESRTSDFNFFTAEKPVPDTVTVAPTGPCVGLTRMDSAVAVNVIATETGAPFTVTDPDEGELVWPETVPTV